MHDQTYEVSLPPAGVSENDALPLEHKLNHRQPCRQVDIGHFVGHAALQRFVGSQELHLKKQPVDFVKRDSGTFCHDL